MDLLNIGYKSVDSKKIIDYADWLTHKVDEFGEWVRKYLKNLYNIIPAKLKQ